MGHAQFQRPPLIRQQPESQVERATAVQACQRSKGGVFPVAAFAQDTCTASVSSCFDVDMKQCAKGNSVPRIFKSILILFYALKNYIRQSRSRTVIKSVRQLQNPKCWTCFAWMSCASYASIYNNPMSCTCTMHSSEARCCWAHKKSNDSRCSLVSMTAVMSHKNESKFSAIQSGQNVF